MPQENCDTGRTIHNNKSAAEDMIKGGQGERCDRCRGWHNSKDRPKSRAGRKAKANVRR